MQNTYNYVQTSLFEQHHVFNTATRGESPPEQVQAEMQRTTAPGNGADQAGPGATAVCARSDLNHSGCRPALKGETAEEILADVGVEMPKPGDPDYDAESGSVADVDVAAQIKSWSELTEDHER